VEQEEDLITVRNADRMDSETFRKHMDVRHNDEPSKWRGMGPFPSDYVEDCWRAFHDTIHRLGLYGDMNHDHGK
jgi:hypothetical protein